FVSTKESTDTTCASEPTRSRRPAPLKPKMSGMHTQLGVLGTEVLQQHEVAGGGAVGDADTGARRGFRDEELVLAELAEADQRGRRGLVGADGAVPLHDDRAVRVLIGDRHRLAGAHGELLGTEGR